MGLSGMMFLIVVLSMLMLDDGCTKGNVLSMVIGALAGGFLTFSDAQENGHGPDENGHSYIENKGENNA